MSSATSAPAIDHGPIVGYFRGIIKSLIPTRNRNGKTSVRVAFAAGIGDDGSQAPLKDAWMSLEGGAGPITAQQLRDIGVRFDQHVAKAVLVIKDGAPVLDEAGHPTFHSEIPDLSNSGLSIRVRLYSDGATEIVGNGVVDVTAQNALAALFAGSAAATSAARPPAAVV